MTSNQNLRLRSGGTESTILTWEVRDSLGFPIDFDHRDTVEFSISGVPVGGGRLCLACASHDKRIGQGFHHRQQRNRVGCAAIRCNAPAEYRQRHHPVDPVINHGERRSARFRAISRSARINSTSRAGIGQPYRRHARPGREISIATP